MSSCYCELAMLSECYTHIGNMTISILYFSTYIYVQDALLYIYWLIHYIGSFQLDVLQGWQSFAPWRTILIIRLLPNRFNFFVSIWYFLKTKSRQKLSTKFIYKIKFLTIWLVLYESSSCWPMRGLLDERSIRWQYVSFLIRGLQFDKSISLHQEVFSLMRKFLLYEIFSSMSGLFLNEKSSPR